jgi:hypothetical protein
MNEGSFRQSKNLCLVRTLRQAFDKETFVYVPLLGIAVTLSACRGQYQRLKIK